MTLRPISSTPKKAFIIPLLLLQAMLHSSCSTGAKDLAVSDSNFETIVILGTNDIHGALAPLKMKTREPEGTPSVEYETGGVITLATYVKRLREEFGNKLIWLDGGDQWQGSVESNAGQGAPMVLFFNSAGLGAAAIGNHEFDYGPERPSLDAPVKDPSDRLGAIKARTAEAKYPYLAANIVDKKSGKPAPFPNAFPSVMMKVGRLNVGIVGLTTLETPHSTFPENVKTLVFQELEASAVREAKKLREAGAHVVLLAAHVGIKCEIGRASPAHQIRKPSDPLGFCGQNDELVAFLRKIPPGTIDAVVSGHSHQVVHHWVEGVPVIQGASSARYFNLIYLTYDLRNGRVAADRTLIEGPVPVCPLVFENQGDCDGERPSPPSGRGTLVKAKFHGKTMERRDADTVEMLRPVFEQSAILRAQVISHAARPIEHDRTRESSLGNLVADAIRDFARSDAALMNSGGIRAPFEQGPIRFESVFRTLPFDNTVTVISVTGKQLKTILRVAQSGARGFHAVSGVKLRLIPLSQEAPASDLDGNGKIDPWEINRLLEVTFEDGSPVRDEATYTLATPDFLALGGDDMKWPMSQIPRSKMRMDERLLRDVLSDYLKTHLPSQEGWNSAEHPLLDPGSPRLVFSKPKSETKKSKRGKSTKRKTGKKR